MDGLTLLTTPCSCPYAIELGLCGAVIAYLLRPTRKIALQLEWELYLDVQSAIIQKLNGFEALSVLWWTDLDSNCVLTEIINAHVHLMAKV